MISLHFLPWIPREANTHNIEMEEKPEVPNFAVRAPEFYTTKKT